MVDDEAFEVLETLAAHLTAPAATVRPGRLAGEILIPLLKSLDVPALIQQIEDQKAMTKPAVEVPEVEAYRMAS